jgi:shikimate kinase / 3-dehydroquinate synthase
VRDLVLTGFMGTGKSTVARILGRRLGYEVVDTDAEIEHRTGRRVAAIFDELGEDEFRRLERDLLLELSTGGGRVVATGGGTLLEAGSRDLVAGSAVICLTADPGTLQDRLRGQTDRPLLRSPESLYRLLAQREEAYARFPQIDTTDRDPDLVADDVARVTGLPLARLDFPSGASSTIVMEEAGAARVGEILTERGVWGRVLLVSDENVDAVGWRSTVADALRAAGLDVFETILPPGEQHKSLLDLDDLYADCLTAGLDRSGTVIGLGGGVVGDLAGMLAATYMRGIRLVLLPTTLLAQVDAAIGGKTAVDAHGVKNIAGAFYPAELVFIDPSLLPTLPRRLLSDGLAEVIKIAMMRSEPLVPVLENLDGVEDIVDRSDVVWTAARLKADIVREDPLERGVRALLNYGHTVGHGLEAAASYRESHGRCVAAGMVAESRASGGNGRVTDCLLTLLNRFELPVTLSEIDPEAAYAAALHDKKRGAGAVRVAVPEAVGRGRVENWTHDQLRRGIASAVGGQP